MSDPKDVVRVSLDGDVASLTVESPPVNALSVAVRKGLEAGLRTTLNDPSIRGVIIICAGRTFFAGADISEFDKPFENPTIQDIQALLDNAAKPVLAAIHGTALGGGLEIALACHFRVASPSAKLGLPEVTLGLLPGAGGTQRLPRLIGARAALDMMAFGKPIGAPEALQLGLVDAVGEGSLHRAASGFLRKVIDEKKPLVRVRDMDERLDEARRQPDLIDAFRIKNARAFRGLNAPANIMKAVAAAVVLPFDQGLEREAELFNELLAGAQSAALRYLFFAERQAAKIPCLPKETPTLPIKRVGVVGAGTMGGGIAMNFLNVGVPVTIVEQKQDALDRGVNLIRQNYQTTVRKGRLTEADFEARMSLLSSSLRFDDFHSADLIIEAVYEDLEIKKEVFSRLDKHAAPHAVLASNTSFLDLNAIAGATSRPERVVGMHFFSPANVMRLLEVVRGHKTADEVVATAMQVGRMIGKVAVLSGVCDGFIANRMMAPRSKIANDLILEGPMPWDIDRVMVQFGFPMGPFSMLDLVGLDVIDWDADTSSSSSVIEILCEMGRWGQKKNGGFYDYDDRRVATPSPIAEKVILEFASKKGVKRRLFSDQEIVERLLFPVVNEGAKILSEGIAQRASDIDLALVNGYGWPAARGGPLFWADTVGLERLVSSLQAMSERLDDARYATAPLLLRAAKDGASLHSL